MESENWFEEPRTWRNLEQAVALRAGWKLFKYRVTSNDAQWHIYKSMRGPKWYVATTIEPHAYIFYRDTKEEALADLPPYCLNAQLCRELTIFIPHLLTGYSGISSEYPDVDAAHWICVLAAQFFNIRLDRIPRTDERKSLSDEECLMRLWK